MIEVETLNRRIVPPHGPLQCKIALIGEAPGKNEHEHGFPFCGASGELLGEILGKANIRRRVIKRVVSARITYDILSEVYSTNLIKYYPENKDFARQFYTDSKATKPTEELIQATKALAEELARCSANVFVPLGEHAFRALTGRYGITKWRGSVMESSLLPGKKVIPMIHPAAVLREWRFKVFCVLDARRITEEAQYPDIRLPRREYLIRPSIAQLSELESRFIKAEYLSFDIETKYGNIACIGFSDNIEFAACIPFISQKHHYWYSQEMESAAWKMVRNVLQGPSKKVAQNALFDLTHLHNHGVIVRNMWHDTMLAQNILYPELPKGLDVLASIYTKEPYYKAEGRSVLRTSKDPKADKAWDPNQADEQLWIYNCKDAAVTLEVALAQRKDFADFTRV